MKVYFSPKQILLLILLALLCSCAQQNKMEETTISQNAYPKFSWDKVPMWGLFHNRGGEYTDEELKYIAAHYDIVGIGSRRGSNIREQIRSLNPDIKFIHWQNSFLTFGRRGGSRFYQEHPDWVLRTKDGDFLTVRGLKTYDLSNPEVRNWWSDLAARRAEGDYIDAVAADAVPKIGMRHNSEIQGQWDEQKYKAVEEGLCKLLAETKQKIGPDKLMLYNGLRGDLQAWEHGGTKYLEWADGGVMEHFGAITARDENGKLKPQFMENDFEIIRQTSRRGKIALVKAWPGDFYWINPKYKDLPQDEKIKLLRERITFPLAAFLIAAEKNCYFAYSWSYGADSGWLEKFDEFDKPLGPPKGPAKKEGWIYTRQFEHASVWLDTENEKAKITWH